MDGRMTSGGAGGAGGPGGGPVEELAARVGVALHDLVPDRAVAPGLVDRVQQEVARRRRHRRDLAAVGSLLVCVVAVVVGVNTLREPRFTTTVGSVGTPSAPSGPASAPVDGARPEDGIDRTKPYFALAPAEVPPEGGTVGLLLADPTGKGALTGLSGRFERWDGSRWTPYRQYVAVPARWGSVGSLYPLDRPGGARSIGITAPASGYSGPLWVRLSPLQPGRYRFVADGGNGGPAGILVVRRGADGAADPGLPAPRFLLLAPVVAGERVELTLSRGQQQNLTGDAKQVTWSSRLQLERWASGTWSAAGSIDLDQRQLERLTGSLGRLDQPVTVQAPALRAGTYRVTLDEKVSTLSLKPVRIFESGLLVVLPSAP